MLIQLPIIHDPRGICQTAGLCSLLRSGKQEQRLAVSQENSEVEMTLICGGVINAFLQRTDADKGK